MAEENLCLVLYENKELKIENHLIPEPGPGQVQLAIQHVGVCGTDVHFWQVGSFGHMDIDKSVVLGHEGSGQITKLGEGVSGLEVGDRVAIEPVVTCLRCHDCKTGRYNLCPQWRASGIPPVDGFLTKYYVQDADCCFKLPDHVTTEEGALMEPLSVAVHACHRAGVDLGSKVLVSGAGAVGLASMMTAKASGASTVCVTDIDQTRLDLAKQLGADVTVNVASMEPKDAAVKISEAIGDKPSITIECCGASVSVQTAIFATRSGGCVALVGFGPEAMDIPIQEAIVREVNLIGCASYANCFPKALALVSSGKVNLKALVTHRFELKDAKQALETTLKREGLRSVVKCCSD